MEFAVGTIQIAPDFKILALNNIASIPMGLKPRLVLRPGMEALVV